MNYFFLFVLIIGPALCVLFCLLGIWENKRADDSIKRLKGVSRPINDINERSTILSLFDFIDYIIIFNDDTPLNVIRTLKPTILVKGSDYTIDNIVGKEYVEKVMFFDFIKNKSSTNVINKIRNS